MADLKVIQKWLIKNNDDIAESSLEGNFKMQKLLYYSQAMMLSNFDRPLFTNIIEGWIDGPVVSQANYYYNIERLPERVTKTELEEIENELTKEETEVLEIVNFVYGRESAQDLIDQTHIEKPWADVKEEALAKKNPIITVESMKDFYKTSLVDIYEIYKGTDFSKYKTITLNSNKFMYNSEETDLSKDDKINLFEIGSKTKNESLFVYKDNEELVAY